jgi:hypothetical protein
MRRFTVSDILFQAGGPGSIGGASESVSELTEVEVVVEDEEEEEEEVDANNDGDKTTGTTALNPPCSNGADRIDSLLNSVTYIANFGRRIKCLVAYT